MISFFLSLVLTLHAAIGQPHSSVRELSSEMEHANFTVLQLQEPESMEAGDEDAYKPYEGFNILAIGMVVVTVLIVGFVVVRVFKRMSRSRRQEAEEQNSIRNKNTH